MSVYHAPTARPRGTLAILAVCALLALLLFAWSRTGPDPATANPLAGMAAVAVGGGHTCAITTAGGVKCWGSNTFGQLGDAAGGSSGDFSLTPVDVSGLTSGVAAVTTGFSHTCALTTGGGVKCWGRNDGGQLGQVTSGTCNIGGNLCSITPVDVVGLTSGVATVTAGGSHTCAVTTGGGAKCWGGNSSGQLGDGTTTDRATPVDVLGTELSRPVGRRIDHRQHHPGERSRADQRCGHRHRWGHPHLRRYHGRRRQVLGIKHLG